MFAELFVLGTNDFLKCMEEGNLFGVFIHSIVNAQYYRTHLVMGTREIMQPEPLW